MPIPLAILSGKKDEAELASIGKASKYTKMSILLRHKDIISREFFRTSQNKCIKYCLNLDNRAHVGIDEFIKINWLPTKERVAQCICVNIFKFFNKMSPQYMSEIFHPSHSRYNTRMATLKLDLPFRQSCPGQKTISYLGPNIWNNLAAETKLRRSVNTFKHDIKKLFFDKLKKQNDDIFFYY